MISGLLCLFATVAMAHDSAVTTVDLTQQEGGWVVQVSLATEGAHAALKAQEPNFESFDAAQWKAALVSHARQTVHITTDAGQVPLGTGGVRAGPHQTDLMFPLELPSTVDHFDITVEILNLHHQTQVVRVHPQGGPVRRAVLNSETGFTVAWPDGFSATVGQRAPADSTPAAAQTHTH